MRKGVLIAVFLLTACSGPSIAPSTTGPLSEEAVASRIDAGGLDPYDPNDYPQATAKLGDAWARVQGMRERSARLALSTGECDRVMYTDLSVMKSTPQQLITFTDCANGKRFTFREGEDTPSMKQVFPPQG